MNMSSVSQTAATNTTLSLSSTTDVSLTGSAPWTVSGIAIGPDDTTKGQSGIKKMWPADELEAAADSLEGRPLVDGHINDASGVIGRVTKSGWDDELGVIFEAEVYDKDIAEKIESGDYEVSIRGYHKPVSEMDETDDGAKIVEDIEFDNLSTTSNGAAPSNNVSMGEHDELAQLAQLQSALSSIDRVNDELAEWTTGDFVQWGEDNHGIILLGPELDDQDDPLVEHYEQDEDNDWYPTGEEETVSTRSLNSWGVDEDNITSEPDEDEDEDEDNDEDSDEAESQEYDHDLSVGDTVSWHSGNGVIKDVTRTEYIVEPYAKDDDIWAPTDFEVAVNVSDARAWNVPREQFDRRGRNYTENEDTDVSEGDMVEWDDGMGEVEEINEDEAFDILPDEEPTADDPIAKILVYEDEDEPSDGNYVVAHVSDLDLMETEEDDTNEDDTDEEAEDTDDSPDQLAFESGDAVEWDAEAGTAVGIVEEGTTDGCFKDEIDGNIEVCAEDDDPVYLIEVYRDGNPTTITVAHHESILSETDEIEPDNTTAENADADYSQGDWVEWDTRNSTEIGKVVGTYEEGDDLPAFRGDRGLSPEGDDVLLALRMYKERDGTFHPIEGNPIGHYAENVRSAESPANVSDNPVELTESDDLDEVYSNWDDAVNMTASELREWSKHPCSREASVEPVSVIRRNLELLETPKDEWGQSHIEDAQRTVSFVERMNTDEQTPDGDPRDGTGGCPTDWAISLLNWAHNPFNEIPDIPDDMEPVEEVELKSYRRTEGSEQPLTERDKENQPHRYPEEFTRSRTDQLTATVSQVDFSGTKDSDSWNALTLSDFTSESWNDLSESEQRDIASHFLIVRGDTPPENFGDLAFPVVDTDGNLDLQGLRAAKTRVSSAGDDIPKQELRTRINQLATEHFDVDWDEENMTQVSDVPTRDAMPDHETEQSYGHEDETQAKQYLYEKGKADGLYDELSPYRDEEEYAYNEEDELAEREYEHDEIEAYENGYRDGRAAADEAGLVEHCMSEYDAEEMRECYAKGVHDGVDPDESETAEKGQYMNNEEQMAYQDGHSDGLEEVEMNRRGEYEKQYDDSEDEDEELAVEGGDSDLDGYVPVAYRDYTMHHDPEAYIKCSKNVSDGTEITVKEAHASREFSLSVHKRGSQYPWHTPSLSGNIGETEPLEPDTVHNNVTIELDEGHELTESQRIYVVMYYVVEGERVNHMLGEDDWIMQPVEVICTEDMSGSTTVSEPMTQPTAMTAEHLAQSDLDLAEGDYVQWDWQDGTAYGQVDEIVSDSCRTVEGNERCPDPDEGEHVAVIEQVDEDGEEEGQRVVKYLREDSENEDNVRSWDGHDSDENSLANSGLLSSGTNTGSTQSDDDVQYVTLAQSTAGLTQYNTTTIPMTDTEELSQYDDPVVLEREEYAELEQVNEGIEELRQRTKVLDEVDRSMVEELRDAESPVVVEEDEFAELEDEVEHVKEMYAEQVAEASAMFDEDELMQKFSIEELRAKYDDVSEEQDELTAEPKGRDRSQDELSGLVQDDGTEQSEEIEEVQAELKEKILSDN